MIGYQTVTEIKPGMHGLYLIDHDKYHEGIGLSSTTVKKALGSYNSFMQPYPDSEAFSFGRAFHAALLEPDIFAKNYILEPDIPLNKNSNAYKEQFAAWLETANGKEVINRNDWALIDGMKNSALKHPHFPATFDAEVMAITTCPDTGVLKKCKSDMFAGEIIDIKSTSGEVSAAEFMRDIIKWKYHVSAAYYQDIIHAVTGAWMDFTLMPVSKKAPFDCQMYTLSDDILEEGRKLYKFALQRIAKWNKMNDHEKLTSDRRKRVLEVNSSMIYNTKEIISFLE